MIFDLFYDILLSYNKKEVMDMTKEELKQKLLENGGDEDVINTVVEEVTTARYDSELLLFKTEQDAEKSIQEVYENWKRKKEKKDS